jgi:dTDP-4-amino-4,6-dideoxygalactose transaminase
MDWKVRYVDYPSQFQKMRQDIMGTIESLLAKGDLMLRHQLKDFETHLAEFVGTRYAVGDQQLHGCSDAQPGAAGIGPGDEVISVSHTFVATIAAIHHTRATPVLVDIVTITT